MTKNLLPCPFCGGKAQTNFMPKMVSCSESFCTEWMTPEAWNHRAPSEQWRSDGAEIVKVIEAVVTIVMADAWPSVYHSKRKDDIDWWDSKFKWLMEKVKAEMAKTPDNLKAKAVCFQCGGSGIITGSISGAYSCPTCQGKGVAGEKGKV